jgi:glycosyltransferase involved in cell wall biosynthesis
MRGVCRDPVRFGGINVMVYTAPIAAIPVIDPVGNRASLRVVMPVHNARPYVGEAIRSVLSDLPKDGELVVIVDGPTDGSAEIVDAIASSDARMHVIRHAEARGVSRAINAGFAHAGCPEYVAIAEHDDVVLRGRFFEQMAALSGDPQLAAVSSEGRYVGPTGRVFGRVSVGPHDDNELRRMVSSGVPVLIPHAAVMYRRSAVVQAGMYDPEFDGAQDLELMNRLVYSCGWAIRTLRSHHLLYRVHDSAMSFSSLSRQRLISRFVRYRNRCLLEKSEPEDFANWIERHRPSRRTRLRWYRHDKGALLYRRAGLAWLSRKPIRFIGALTGAALLHPRIVFSKLRILGAGDR